MSTFFVIMRVIGAILLLVVLSTSAAFSQPRYSPETLAKRESQWMKDSLHLNNDQFNKVIRVNLDYSMGVNKYRPLPQSGERTQAFKGLITKKNDALKKVLTKEQFRKYYKREQEQEAIEREKEQNTNAGHRKRL